LEKMKAKVLFGRRRTISEQSYKYAGYIIPNVKIAVQRIVRGQLVWISLRRVSILRPPWLRLLCSGTETENVSAQQSNTMANIAKAKLVCEETSLIFLTMGRFRHLHEHHYARRIPRPMPDPPEREEFSEQMVLRAAEPIAYSLIFCVCQESRYSRNYADSTSSNGA
jgi:hypothetical protein